MDNDMKSSNLQLRRACIIASFCAGVTAHAAGAVPTYQVDASWPGVLPNNWAMGQVGGLAMGAQDHVFVIHRPKSIGKDQLMAGMNPPGAECCVAAPPVIEFDRNGKIVRAWGG